MNIAIRSYMAVAVGLALGSMAAAGAEPPKPGAGVLPRESASRAEQAVRRGLAFLKGTQNAEGGWTARYGPAVTAIVTRAFAQDEAYGPEHPVVKRAVAAILKYRQSDGGIYDRTQNIGNYQTSVVLMLLAGLDDPALRPHIARAQRYLTTLQYDAGESIDAGHAWYGGAGYGKSKRPDLSNTQMMLEALRESGLPPSDPVYRRALKFVSRCQMLGSTNDLPFARGATDGGFIYSPNAGGESKADRNTAEGVARHRTYGSMTYAGFKSMLYANVGRDDARIKAALGWIRRHYTLDVNPNMPGRRSRQGLYYYYHVFARALQAWGEPVITDAAGRPHNWRIDLCRKLTSLQKPDGSWINEQERWLESDPNYVTGLTVLTLQAALTQAGAKHDKSSDKIGRKSRD